MPVPFYHLAGEAIPSHSGVAAYIESLSMNFNAGIFYLHLHAMLKLHGNSHNQQLYIAMYGSR